MKKQLGSVILSLSVAFALMAALGACRERPWVEFKPDDRSFTVFFPVTPTKTVKTLNTALGPLEATLYEAEVGGLFYSVGVMEYPPDHIEETGATAILDAARDGAVATSQGTLLLEEILTISGNPGRELKVAIPAGKATARQRVVLVGNRLFMAGVVAPSDNTYAQGVRRFFDSFSITGPKP